MAPEFYREYLACRSTKRLVSPSADRHIVTVSDNIGGTENSSVVCDVKYLGLSALIFTVSEVNSFLGLSS